MPKGKSDQKSAKGVPRKSRNPLRKLRRSKNAAKQPERKLRHLLKHNGIRPAFEWADKHSMIAILRSLRPGFQAELAGTKYE